MNYSATCECGTVIPVTSGEAGADKRCACGRAVSVPSLRELRQQVGETLDRKPELAIPRRVAEGELPRGETCAACNRPTDTVLRVRATVNSDASVFDRAVGNMLMTFVFGVVIGPIVAMIRSIETRRGRSTVEMPLKACADCASELNGPKLKAALASVPVYAELLEKYPGAKLKTLGVKRK